MISPQLRRWLAIGSGIGIEVEGIDLLIVAVRIRFERVRILGEYRIENFSGRPAAEWGAEYNRFLNSIGLTHLAAHLLLPREVLTIRVLSLPPIRGKELDAAIRFQLDSLHPYAEENVVHRWTQLEQGGDILVAIARQQTVSHYETLFAEAGIQLASLSSGAAALYSAVRLFGPPAESEFAALEAVPGGIEIYGESPAKALLSAFVDAPAGRAAAIARAELRLAPETRLLSLREILPAAEPSATPVQNESALAVMITPKVADFTSSGTQSSAPPATYQATSVADIAQSQVQLSSRGYAAALCAACPLLALDLNLLPKEARKSNSRLLYLPTAVFALVLIFCAIALAVENSWEQKRYLKRLQIEISHLEPTANRAQWLERAFQEGKRKAQAVDAFRSRSRADLDAINELTRILPPPTWVNSLDMDRTSASLSGDTPDAAGLLKTIDASPLFQGTAFQQGIGRTSSGTETFRVKTQREQVVP